MDLRAYYQRLQDVQETITGDDVVVVSLATPDGGKAGVTSEVNREVGARMVVDGKARLADAAEAKEYRDAIREARARVEQAAAAERMQVTVISDNELRSLRERARQRG